MEEKPATIFPMFSISVLGINVHLTGDLSIMMMMMMTVGNLLASHDDDDDDDVNDDVNDDDDDDDFNQRTKDQCPVDKEFFIHIPHWFLVCSVLGGFIIVELDIYWLCNDN